MKLLGTVSNESSHIRTSSTPIHCAISLKNLALSEKVIKSRHKTRSYGNTLPSYIRIPTRASKVAARIEGYQLPSNLDRLPQLFLQLPPFRQHQLLPCQELPPTDLFKVIQVIAVAGLHLTHLLNKLWKFITIATHNYRTRTNQFGLPNRDITMKSKMAITIRFSQSGDICKMVLVAWFLRISTLRSIDTIGSLSAAQIEGDV